MPTGAKIVHGHAVHGHHSRTYNTWLMMRRRCDSPKATSYQNYGGRGIKVCERWQSFVNFLADMGERPEGKSIDRWPNKDGNYEPGNCRWATPHEQLMNRRPRTLVTHCRHGHEYTTENIRWYKGRRHCRACSRAHSRAQYWAPGGQEKAYIAVVKWRAEQRKKGIKLSRIKHLPTGLSG